jgi:queuine tRNA-ribosyltransferase
LRHLYKAREILGLRLNTIHNLHFLVGLMQRIRKAIVAGAFGDLKASFLSGYRPAGNEEQRQQQISRRREKASLARKD